MWQFEFIAWLRKFGCGQMDEIVRRLRDNPNYKFKGEKKKYF